jgi:8-oxo-dGTP pyrophosphatase MutT (NUDIX family)
VTAQPGDAAEHRLAARVIAVDDGGRVLLMRGYDPADPSNVWWITPGGGLEPGEDERTGAVRELFEESGLRIEPERLAGPVAVRTALFSFMGRPYRQDEVLFFARVTGATTIDRSGWTDIERASVTELRWWSADDLDAVTEPVYPPTLPAIVRGLVEQGWDGTPRVVD